MLKSKFGLTGALMLLAIALWLASAWYLWDYRQNSRGLRSLETQVADTRRVLVRLEPTGDRETLQQQLATLQQELASDAVPFPRGDVSLNVADLIVQAAARSGVDLTEAAEAPADTVTIGEGKYKAIRYRLKMLGTAAQFRGFLGQVELAANDESSAFRRLRSLGVDEMKLANTGGDRWSCNFELVVYTQL